jgi:L(+)-tartrate dehydratase beta subunit
MPVTGGNHGCASTTRSPRKPLFGIRDATQIHMFDHVGARPEPRHSHAVIHTRRMCRRLRNLLKAGYRPICCIGT